MLIWKGLKDCSFKFCFDMLWYCLVTFEGQLCFKKKCTSFAISFSIRCSNSRKASLQRFSNNLLRKMFERAHTKSNKFNCLQHNFSYSWKKLRPFCHLNLFYLLTKWKEGKERQESSITAYIFQEVLKESEWFDFYFCQIFASIFKVI